MRLHDDRASRRKWRRIHPVRSAEQPRSYARPSETVYHFRWSF